MNILCNIGFHKWIHSAIWSDSAYTLGISEAQCARCGDTKFTFFHFDPDTCTILNRSTVMSDWCMQVCCNGSIEEESKAEETPEVAKPTRKPRRKSKAEEGTGKSTSTSETPA